MIHPRFCRGVPANQRRHPSGSCIHQGPYLPYESPSVYHVPSCHWNLSIYTTNQEILQYVPSILQYVSSIQLHAYLL